MIRVNPSNPTQIAVKPAPRKESRVVVTFCAVLTPIAAPVASNPAPVIQELVEVSFETGIIAPRIER